MKGDGTVTEDGTEHTVTATVENGTGYKVEYKVDDGEWSTTAPSLKEVGKLFIQIRATKEGKTTLTADATLEITAKLEPKLVVSGAGSFEHDGKAHTVTARVENGEGTLDRVFDGGKTWSTTAPSLTEVGKLTIEIRATKAEQPELKETVTLEVTAKAEPKLVVEGAGSFEHDGKAHTVTAKVENGEGLYRRVFDRRRQELEHHCAEPDRGGQADHQDPCDQERGGHAHHGGRHAGGEGCGPKSPR